jgi:ribosomal protein S27AE
MVGEHGAKMQCPKCGAAMNHHADKLVEPTDARDAALLDPELGGVIREIHGCPRCGAVASRTASPGPYAGGPE